VNIHTHPVNAQKQKLPQRDNPHSTRHQAMVAFKIESWIWYAVVLLIAGSRLLVSQVHAHAHAQMHKSPSNPSPAQCKTPIPSPLRPEYPATPEHIELTNLRM
jgi:hypothetical protein